MPNQRMHFQASKMPTQAIEIHVLVKQASAEIPVQDSGMPVQDSGMPTQRMPVQVLGMSTQRMPVETSGMPAQAFEIHVQAIRIALGPSGYLFTPLQCLFIRYLFRVNSLWEA